LQHLNILNPFVSEGFLEYAASSILELLSIVPARMCIASDMRLHSLITRSSVAEDHLDTCTASRDKKTE
jgi:hypothetical protein